MAARIRIGTCSWADDSLVKYWYRPGMRSGEERLRYYAQHFDTVEANSTYYRLPEESMVANWAERVPDGFVMHVKAFGMMTRHPVKAYVLPPDLREGAPADERGRVDRPPRELRAEIFARFHVALEPLRTAGKLGGILLQFPSYIVCKPYSFEYLEWAKEQLRGDRMLVEFRHRSWLDEENRERVLAFLEELGATHVIVDAPKTEAKNLVPTVVALTSPIGYVRLHGRNAKTWNVRGKSAAERFDYLYSEDELSEWTEPLEELAQAAEEVYVMFNNNGRSRAPDAPKGWISQAPTNALMLRHILQEQGAPV
ncbi:MAG TPA: DUF72 domain-containing protein [Gaiellaceae bacterium]|nr:DUF72 domain-containing protein [Gaiellaceae bacterium]